MSRNPFSGPKLPSILLDKVQNGSATRRQRSLSRKDRRKAERQRRKPNQSSRLLTGHRERSNQHLEDLEEQLISDDDNKAETRPRPDNATPRVPSTSKAKPLKSILKQQKEQPEELTDVVPESDDESDASSLVISTRAAKQGLAHDDAEIASLEKRLGIKGKSQSTASGNGELDWLMGDSDEDSDGDSASLKRKRPEDRAWLRDKRLKVANLWGTEDAGTSGGDRQSKDVRFGNEDGQGEEEDPLEDDNQVETPSSEDEMDSDDFKGFSSETELSGNHRDASSARKRQRENPYVAPVSMDNTSNKYIPPSLRRSAGSDEEALKQIRRQVQGSLNKLSESNIISILQSIEDIYSKNARQHVSQTLVDLIVALVSDPSILSDSFLILHAAFCAAVYRIMGADFGAQLLERLIEAYEAHEYATKGKRALNIIAFLAGLYNFQVVGSTIMFDYLRHFLQSLSENNTELLLRVIRTSGQTLRHDDPSSLKDAVLLLQRAVASVGSDNLSVRTKFMIETINDLKNNRVRGGATGSTLANEQITRLKKTLGSLNSRAKINEPLRMSLSDIKESDKKGKWWLIGASYHDSSKMADGGAKKFVGRDDSDDGYESETPGHVNLRKLAQQQGMNTDVRRAIFVVILSSADCVDAHHALLRLNLKSKQLLEIPRILIHCVSNEQKYNPYYALIAQRFCAEHKLRKAFIFSIWDAFKHMEKQDDDDDETDDGRASPKFSMRKIVNIAKFCGMLVVNNSLNLLIFKKIDFTHLSSNLSMFVEAMLTATFAEARKAKEGLEKVAQDIFGQVHRNPQVIQGLQFFIQTTLSRADLASGKREVKAVKRGCQFALKSLDGMAKHTTVVSDEDDADNYKNDDDK